MFLILGLGNPGPLYQLTPHNAGFLTLDALARKTAGNISFSLNKNLHSEILKTKFHFIPLLLAKPETFMNRSGLALTKLMRYYKIDIARVIVVHDDIDICAGKIKIQKNKNAAGHKGVENIIAALKTKDFFRVRIGVNFLFPEKIKAEKTVVKSLTKKQQAILNIGVEKAAEDILSLLNQLTASS